MHNKFDSSDSTVGKKKKLWTLQRNTLFELIFSILCIEIKAI